jgi:hypothetical protein
LTIQTALVAQLLPLQAKFKKNINFMSQNKKIFSSSVLFYAILFIFSFSLLFAPQIVHGQEAHDWSSWEIIPSECLTKDGDCNLNSFVNLFVNLSYIMLKVTPYLAMLMMIIGGFSLIVAGGKQERVQTGKRVITSVLLGTVIIIGLAWVLSFFVVSALTGDTDQESGKIFKGYSAIWEKEWWGGGESMVYPINSGCCVVNGVGCKEMTKEECQNIKNLFPSADPQFMGENQFCDQYTSSCKNYTIPGCCVSLAVDGPCGYPGANGCLDYNNTQYATTSCQNLGICLGKILGEPPDESKTGCCISDDSCFMTSYQNCYASFQLGTNCNSIEECTNASGCCIYETGCHANKINCGGIWSTSDCGALSSECATGCCEIPDNCTNDTTRGWCGTFDNEIFSEGVPCLAGCIGGCCQGNCTDNKINWNCPFTDPSLEYVDNDCSTVGACTNGCCRFNNATLCTDDVTQGDCDGHFWAGFACGGIGDCNLGCCYNPNDNHTCYQNVASGYCVLDVIGGIFNGTADCSGLNECDTGPGCCVIGGGGPPDYNCQNLTSTQTRAYCENILGGLLNRGVACEDDPPYSGICFP